MASRLSTLTTQCSDANTGARIGSKQVPFGVYWPSSARCVGIHGDHSVRYVSIELVETAWLPPQLASRAGGAGSEVFLWQSVCNKDHVGVNWAWGAGLRRMLRIMTWCAWIRASKKKLKCCGFFWKICAFTVCASPRRPDETIARLC